MPSPGRKRARPAAPTCGRTAAMSGARRRTRTWNVLVIGSGAAGLRAASAASQAGAAVVVIGKRRRVDAHTVVAAGGINAARGTGDPQDSWEEHFAGTVR